jgi:hypothetical protein
MLDASSLVLAAETPYVIWLIIIVVGVVGSIATLGGILLIFIREFRSGELW